MKNKKASTMPIEYIAMLILVLISLIVLIYVATQATSTKDIDREACKTSVQLRSALNLNSLVEPGKDYIALECKTEKICITKSGDDCDAQGFEPSGNNKITKIKVGTFDTTKAVTIETISDALYNCNWQLGGGELNFMPSELFSQNYCPICARIALDEEARQELQDVSYFEVYQYMQQNKDGEGISDLEHVYEVKTVGELLPALTDIAEGISEEYEVDVKPSDLKIDLKDKDGVAVISILSTQGTLSTWTGTTVGTGASVVGLGTIALGIGEISLGLLGAPFTGGASLALTLKGAAVLVVGVSAGYGISQIDMGTQLGDENIAIGSGPIFVREAPGGATFAKPTLISYDAELLKALNCDSFEFLN